jgi:hypothetical protein
MQLLKVYGSTVMTLNIPKEVLINMDHIVYCQPQEQRLRSEAGLGLTHTERVNYVGVASVERSVSAILAKHENQ